MGQGGPDYYHPQYVVTVPAFTAIAAPVAVDLANGPRLLDTVEVRIPPGPSGNVGFRIVWSGKQLVPWSDGPDWIVADDDRLTFDIGLQVDSQLELEAYNLDVWPHTIYVRLLERDLITAPRTSSATLLDVSAIDAAAAGTD